MEKGRRIISRIIPLIMILALIVPMEALSAGPKNVIYFVGDGLSTVQRRAPEIVLGKKLFMNSFPVLGLYTTYCLDAIITDSAAAGTALATGHKTNSGVISMDPTGKIAYETLAEAAKRLGKSVGLVTTTRITHATPACFGAHVIDRDMENEVAEQYLKQGFEVYMGGGLRNFIPKSERGSKRKDDIDLISDFKKGGYDVVTNLDELSKLNINRKTKVLGLFSKSHMPYHIDKPDKAPSLSDMTAAAIEVLKQNPKGFFLMVEGGRVDHGAHSNDPVATIFNTVELDNAVKTAAALREVDPDTLIFVGGDHETGGMGLGVGLNYFVKTDVILAAKKTHAWAGKTYKKKPDSDPVAIMITATGISDFTPEEIKAIQMAAANVRANKKTANKYNKNYMSFVYADIVTKRAHVGWTSWAHTANPAVCTAIGPGSEKFAGYYDNIEPAIKVTELWGTTLKSWQVKEKMD